MRRVLTLAALVGLAAAMAGADEPPAPKLSAAQRAKAKRELSRNLKEIGLAFHNSESVNQHFPASADYAGPDGKALLSWRVAVLPYIEQAALFGQFKLDEPFDSPHNLKVVADNPMPDFYKSPGAAGKKTRLQGFASGAKVAPHPALPLLGGTRIADFTDGLSNTILVTLAKDPVEWTKPADIPYTPGADLTKLVDFGPDGQTPLKCVFADGSLHEIRPDVGARTFEALVTRDGGEVVRDEDWRAK